jgi:predicted transcriptional regulator
MPSVDTRVMTAHVPLPLAEQVDQLAAKLERSRGWVLKQALAAYVDREAERYRMTVEAMADVDARSGVSHQDVKSWAASLSTDKPGQLPE